MEKHSIPKHPVTHNSISVVVVAKNEADRIGAMLDSVSFADEIIVVDSGSTDATVAISETKGAKVIFHEWEGYLAQKQFAMKQAAGEWVLNLDADEVLSSELTNEIREFTSKASKSVNGFSMPRLSRYLNHWIRHGGWYPDRKVRLVRRGKGRWVGSGLHEKLEVEGTVHSLSDPILHYVYRNISDQIATIDKFSSVSAQSVGTPRGSLHVVLGVFHAAGKFLECAIWKLGVLDGVAGIVIAMNSAFYVFLKHAKAWEIGLAADESQIDKHS